MGGYENGNWLRLTTDDDTRGTLMLYHAKLIEMALRNQKLI